MTKRMLAAIEDLNMDILGHCTGRIVVGRGRPQSEFDHAAVFAACRDNDVAVEINSDRSAKTRRAICSSLPSICRPPSIPMHMHRVSSSGNTSAVTAPPSVVSPKTA